MLFAGSAAMAQQHVIKITPLKLLPVTLSNLQLGYEYALNDRVSIGADLKVGFPRNLTGGGGILEGYFEGDASVESFRLTGYALTPQVRFYFGQKGAPAGFYLSPWLRIAQYRVASDFLWEDLNEGNSNIEADFTYGLVGGGLSLGWQWLLGDHFVIDWNIGLGGFAGRLGLEGSATGPLRADAREFVDELNREFADVPYINPAFDSEGGEISGSVVIPVSVFRSNLSIGWAF